MEYVENQSEVMGGHLLHKYGTNELKLLVFEVEGIHFGVNLAKVREALSMDKYKIYTLSAARAEHYLGNINVRGEIVPVINIPGYLGQDTTDIKELMGIIAEYDDQKLCFVVNEIHRNMNVSWDAVLPPGFDIIGDTSVITGFVLNEERIIQLLDFERIRDDVLGRRYHIESFNPKSKKQKQILYAEDSPHVRKIVGDILKNSGYQITSCENGRIALDTYLENSKGFDLVLSDIEMPQLDGTALVAGIRGHVDGADIPIVLMSSMTIEQNIKQYLSSGATAFVGKNEMNRLRDELLTLIG